MKVVLLLLAVFAVVLISGCIGAPVQTGSGVSIESFTTDFTRVFSGETTNFYVKARNMGSVDANNAHAELLGVDQDWCCTPAGQGSWQNNEKLPNEPDCQYTGSGFSLRPPDQFWGTSGEYKVCSWTYKVPELPRGATITYNPTVRVFYDYTSHLSQSITILARNDMIAYQNAGQALPTQVISQSRSPISISAETANPIRFTESSVTFPVKITVRNTGGGTACLPGECKKEGSWNDIKLKIGAASSEGISISSSECSGEIALTLYKGQDNTITCDVTASNLRPEQGAVQKILEIDAQYGYFIDQSMTITAAAQQV